MINSKRFKTKIAIKLPVPKWKLTQEWGDYHLGLGLKREFERKGCDVIIQTLSEWYNGDDADCDVVLVLRGLTSYNTKKNHFNIMWNISHPDLVKLEEYNQYDHVFIASELWANKISKEANIPVTPLLQCTDTDLFYPDHDNKYEHELLFVGNSRNVYRKIIKDLIPTDKDLSVYGTNWENTSLDKKYITGEHIPNKELRKAYSSCKILLNDHWEDMREKGFISNRLFDGFASGAFIISDEVKGVSDVFGDALVTYNSPEELKNLIDKYLEDDSERNEKSIKGREIVNKHHTYVNRVEEMLKIIKSNISPEICFQNDDLGPNVFVDQLWNALIFPALKNIQPRNIVEICSEPVTFTKNILEYCQDNPTHFTVITSSLNRSLDHYKMDYKDFDVFTGKNSEIRAKLDNYDILFLDGDRDLNVILNELKLIENSFKTKKFPITFIYNIKQLYCPTSTESEPNDKNCHYYNIIKTIEEYIIRSDSDLFYQVTEAYNGLLIVSPQDDAKVRIIESTYENSNLLRSLEEERQKFTQAYHESKSLIDSLESKLIEKKVDHEIIQEELKQTQTKLKNQINTSNRLSNEKDFLIRKLNESRNQYKELNAKFEIVSNNLLESRYYNGKNRSLLQKLISRFPSLYILYKINKTGFKNSLINIKGYRAIKKNKLFDIGFYLRNNPDVRLSGQDPILHYLYSGFEEGYWPNPYFDGNAYIKKRGDVRKSYINPLVHYSLYGIDE